MLDVIKHNKILDVTVISYVIRCSTVLAVRRPSALTLNISYYLSIFVSGYVNCTFLSAPARLTWHVLLLAAHISRLGTCQLSTNY